MRFLLQSLALIAFLGGARAQQPLVVPQAVYAAVGSSYSVHCSCDGCGAVILQFLFNNSPNPPSARYNATSAAGAATLQVVDVDVSDAKVSVVCQSSPGQMSAPVGVTVYYANVTNATAEISKSKTVNITINVLALNSVFGLGTWHRGVFPNGTALTNNVDGYTITNTVANVTNGTLFGVNATYNLLINKPEDKHAGPYYVLFIQSEGVYIYSYVNSLPYLTFEPAPEGGRSYTTYDEMTFTISCLAQGYPRASSVSWSVMFSNGTTLNAANWARVSLSNNRLNQTNGSLQIVNIDYTDRATYKCIAMTYAGNSSLEYLVRVKDPLAPLWPAIGVIAEIVVLALVIVLYEKFKHRFSSSDAEEEDDGRADGAHSGQGYSQPSGVELRQRNAH